MSDDYEAELKDINSKLAQVVPQAEAEALEEANNNKPIPLTTITEKEGCKNVPVPKWRVEELIPSEGVTYFAGNSNSMKTFTAIYFAQKIASGEPVFNKFKVIPAPVIYIDEENGATIILNRANRLRKGIILKLLINYIL